ncbi:MAG: hypothetical protein WC378_11225 [Opitutaceae bacterium]|jgi:hypothetical protein
MKVLKAFFLGRSMREKVILLAFLFLAVAIWASAFSTRAQSFVSVYRRTGGTLAEQGMWLGKRESIEANAKKAISQLDPSLTLDGTKLLAEVNRIAAQAGLTSNVQADDTRDEHTSQFVVHSLRFTVRKADYATLVRFYLDLQRRSPYIGIEQFALQAEAANPAQLTASLRLSSVEVIR